MPSAGLAPRAPSFASPLSVLSPHHFCPQKDSTGLHPSSLLQTLQKRPPYRLLQFGKTSKEMGRVWVNLVACSSPAAEGVGLGWVRTPAGHEAALRRTGAAQATGILASPGSICREDLVLAFSLFFQDLSELGESSTNPCVLPSVVFRMLLPGVCRWGLPLEDAPPRQQAPLPHQTASPVCLPHF